MTHNSVDCYDFKFFFEFVYFYINKNQDFLQKGRSLRMKRKEPSKKLFISKENRKCDILDTKKTSN